MQGACKLISHQQLSLYSLIAHFSSVWWLLKALGEWLCLLLWHGCRLCLEYLWASTLWDKVKGISKSCHMVWICDTLILINNLQANAKVYFMESGKSLTSWKGDQSASKCSFAMESMIGMKCWRVSDLKNSITTLRTLMESCSDSRDSGENNTFSRKRGHHEVTYFFSFENINLFPKAPQNTAKFSPNSEVWKRFVEYLLILSIMNISGFPFVQPWNIPLFPQSLAIPFYPEGNWHEYWTFVYIWWGRWKAKKYKGLQGEESLGRNHSDFLNNTNE